MSKLVDYKFDLYQWPPPKSRHGANTYIFGFDEDNQPYIVKYDKTKGREGWVATTICDHKLGHGSATVMEYSGETVDKLLACWADAPALYREVVKIKEDQRKKDKEKRKDREDDERY